MGKVLVVRAAQARFSGQDKGGAMNENGRHDPAGELDFDEFEKTEGDNYSATLLLEDLESLREQMDEAGVDNMDQVRRWLDQPLTDQAVGVPSAADRANLFAVFELMQELEISNRQQLDERIRQLQQDAFWGDESE